MPNPPIPDQGQLVEVRRRQYVVTYVAAGSNLAKSFDAANLPVIRELLTSGCVGVGRVMCAN